MRRTTIAGATEPPSNPPKRVEATRPALSTSSRRGRPLCLPEQQRTPSDAPKGQQLTAQGIALGFCVGVVFFALKVQKLLPLQGGLPLASYNPGRCPGLAAIGLSGRCEHPAHFPPQSSICLYNLLYRHFSLKVVKTRRFSLHIYCIFQTIFVNLHRISEEWICPQPRRGGALDMLNLIP